MKTPKKYFNIIKINLQIILDFNILACKLKYVINLNILNMLNKLTKKILLKEHKFDMFYIYKTDFHNEFYLTKLSNLNLLKSFLVKLLIKFV